MNTISRNVRNDVRELLCVIVMLTGVAMHAEDNDCPYSSDKMSAAWKYNIMYEVYTDCIHYYTHPSEQSDNKTARYGSLDEACREFFKGLSEAARKDLESQSHKGENGYLDTRASAARTLIVSAAYDERYKIVCRYYLAKAEAKYRAEPNDKTEGALIDKEIVCCAFGCKDVVKQKPEMD